MYKIDVTIAEVDPPSDLSCATGHKSPETFRREGPKSPALPIRFFRVSTNELKGVYCEPCIIIANWYGRAKREGKL